LLPNASCRHSIQILTFNIYVISLVKVVLDKKILHPQILSLLSILPFSDKFVYTK